MVKNVLIVDDDRDLGELLEMAFTMLGDIKVFRAFDGQEGYDKAVSIKPDLIIMDYKMPGMNGWESARLIRDNADIASTPIVGYTAWASKEDIQKGLQKIGLNEILTKPIDMDVWADKLNKYLS
jgi:DNA-binding response OmpR family regulator